MSGSRVILDFRKSGRIYLPPGEIGLSRDIDAVAFWQILFTSCIFLFIEIRYYVFSQDVSHDENDSRISLWIPCAMPK